jgi:hypothetical protein
VIGGFGGLHHAGGTTSLAFEASVAPLVVPRFERLFGPRDAAPAAGAAAVATTSTEGSGATAWPSIAMWSVPQRSPPRGSPPDTARILPPVSDASHLPDPLQPAGLAGLG